MKPSPQELLADSSRTETGGSPGAANPAEAACGGQGLEFRVTVELLEPPHLKLPSLGWSAVGADGFT